MAERRTNDLPGSDAARPTETRDRYKLHELSEMLDAPVEKVRGWLQGAGINPVHPNYPEDYGLDAFEYVRVLQKQA